MFQKPLSFYCYFLLDDCDLVSLDSKTPIGMLSLIDAVSVDDECVFHGYVVFDLYHLDGTNSGDTHEIVFSDLDTYIDYLEDLKNDL